MIGHMVGSFVEPFQLQGVNEWIRLIHDYIRTNWNTRFLRIAFSCDYYGKQVRSSNQYRIWCQYWKHRKIWRSLSFFQRVLEKVYPLHFVSLWFVSTRFGWWSRVCQSTSSCNRVGHVRLDSATVILGTNVGSNINLVTNREKKFSKNY